MKKLLLLGVALLGLCTLGQTAQAGPDEPNYDYQRPAPRVYEGRVAEPRYYLPPPPPVYVAPPPVVLAYGYPRFHRRHFYPYGYGGYGYGYAPGVHIGIGF